ncbi:AraC family transcriptional regulator [Aquimarina litoralis]|uniref:AraC family transcriptional regulator n=1 Tax=Aquimarina litoralis TaxID=584605 RepID=UPI001C58F08E|nr:AraC family transcriptional regulator [Aquimarina litoralis]MBW1297120.1 helix-turn-helix domain-containing protein [Aquimarina litoralis]
MKLAYEQIYVEQSKSLKIESYTKDSLCNEVNWHLHPEYEIVFIKNGNGIVQVASNTEKYEDGLLIFLGPNIPHMPFGNKDVKDNVEVVIQFNQNFISDRLKLFPEFSAIQKFIHKMSKGCIFSKGTKNKLSNSFLKFATQNNTEKLLNFLQILHQLSISKDTKPIFKSSLLLEIDKTSLPRISKVFEYVNNNYSKKIQSKSIAKELGLTTNSFCRIFKSATDKSFICFLNEFRIKKAQEYFENDNTSISEVLYKCGFNDPSYFCKQFKKHIGISPSSYINSINKS